MHSEMERWQVEREILKLNSKSLKLDTADFVYLPRLLLTTFFSDKSKGRGRYRLSVLLQDMRFLTLEEPLVSKGQ